MQPKIDKIFSRIIIAFVIASISLLSLPSLQISNSQAGDLNLLSKTWVFRGNNGAVERYKSIPAGALIGQDTLQLTYNLHGTTILGGDASAIIFDQPYGGNWHYISLSNYGKNGMDGIQTVNIPLSRFPGLDATKPVGTFHARFWHSRSFNIEITKAKLINTSVVNPTIAPTITSQPAPTAALAPTPTSAALPSPTPTGTPTPIATSTPNPTPLPTSGYSWPIQSVSSMKETKDKICGQDSQVFIDSWVDKAKNLGANYVAVETPYDNPSCGDALNYTRMWVNSIRSRGLKVWHRHMPLAFEGIYSVAKNNGSDYLNMITDYIKNNPSLFAEGDIFTPIPEPQNGGISGITYCAEGVCQYNNAGHFNQWLRNAMTASDNAFSIVGLGGKLKIGYYGFDGFVAWGDNNPDWNGILEDATIQQMGNITIDHYPQLVNDSMVNDLNELQARYPNVPIVIGEWGTVTSGDLIQQVVDNMSAAKRPGVVGFNYWHMGMGGNEALINDDFTSRSQYSTVQSYFKNTR
ncbi:MAG: hypothetical protein UT63_C0023G0011 [Candidatus Gottesmanbacteria bacterium GW2011_GWC2_39_8]|uniref:Glycoside hydrolase family 5 domain-containing protein n=1 Tax=Candidatus Gottesmanbacteria bacterium GW2011_GWC2_39_8 TaxID=1618450 RepID=A0A0G0PYZ7_9BACT|nr:MAG: hypothetical protein UT63_C0023G0011 [Candidatus Gottesmanbacteria bacterium GW2011_GWC2_39_8]